MPNRRDNTVLNRSASAPNEGRPPVWNTGGQDQGKWIDPQRPEHGRSFQRQNLGPTIDRSQPLGPQGQEETRSKDQLFESQGSTAGSFDEFWGGVIKGREGRAQEKLELDQNRLGFDEKKEANRQLEWGLGHSREANWYEDQREDERADTQLARNMAVFDRAFAGGQAGEVLSTTEGRAKANDILKVVGDLAKSDKPMEEILPSIVAHTGMLNKLFGVDPEAQKKQSPIRTWEDQKPMWEAMKEMGYADDRTMNLVIEAMEKQAMKEESEWLKDAARTRNEALGMRPGQISGSRGRQPARSDERAFGPSPTQEDGWAPPGTSPLMQGLHDWGALGRAAGEGILNVAKAPWEIGKWALGKRPASDKKYEDWKRQQ